MTVAGRPRLQASTLAYARADARPEYDRSAAPVIAHLGFGAFARAHLSVYADDLLRRGAPALIRGVSLRSRRAEDQLGPQDGLFTVAVREPGATVSLRVVGALSSMETGPAAALEAMTAPATKLVTLTITEKGYDGGGLRGGGDEPPPSEAAGSAPALIALALARRRRAGLAPPVLASLDNLLDNGNVLRARVVDAAHRIDPSLAEWIAREVRFPSSVVDRMVPAPTEDDLEDIAGRLGLIDRAAVSAERHRSWVIRSVDALAPLADVGVELVDDVAPFERRKLWLLNGPHSAVAYGGLLAGHETIAGAVADPAIARFVRHLVDDTLEVAEFPAALKPAAFADEALAPIRQSDAGPHLRPGGYGRLEQVGAATAPGRGRPPGTGPRHQRVRRRRGHLDRGDRRRRGPRRTASPIGGPARRRAPRRGVPRHRPDQLSHVALGGRADPPFVAEVAGALVRMTTEGACCWRRNGDGDAGRAGAHPRARGGPALRARAGRRTGPGRALALRGHPRWHPDLPAAPAPAGRRRRGRRPGQPLDRRGRARHPCADDRRGHRHPRRSGVRPGGQPRLVGGRHVRPRGHAWRRSSSTTCPGGGWATRSTCASTGWSSRAT